MLSVTTPRDPITARAKMDFVEMELSALVSIAICNVFFSTSQPKCVFRLEENVSRASGLNSPTP